MTKEGPEGVQELIEFLKVQQPLPPLEWQQEMMPASRDHVLDTGPSGKTGHDGTDGSSPHDRQSKYVKVEGNSGENIDYGEKDPQDVIIALMCDDGIPGRGHRKNIFNKQFKKMCCFTGDHKVYKKQTVLNYNGSTTDMKAFMSKEVDFGAPPVGCTGFSVDTKMGSNDTQMIKTSTITYGMKDGSSQQKVVTEA